MKKIFKYMALALSAVLMAGFTACSDDTDADKDKGATPVIKFVRSCDINKKDSLIVAASLGAQLCFVGDNLGDVQQIWFNDQKCKLNPTLVTSHTIVCTVPQVIPGEVSNIARFITSTGIEVEYPFEITVPGPRVEKMSLEYAPAGSQVVINGAYFVDDPNVPMTVTFAGGAEAKINDFTQTELYITVPEGAQPGPITVSTIYGKTVSTLEYMDQRGMLFTFDDARGNHGWHNAVIETDDNAISGNYMRLGDPEITMSEDGGWDDNHYAFEYWAGDWTDPVSYPAGVGDRLIDVVDFSDWKNMSLKFELCVPAANAWQAGAMQVIFAGTDIISMGNPGVDIYGNTVAGCNNTFFQEDNNPGYPRGIYRPWTESQAFDTADQWITVEMPLSQFNLNMNGASATQGLAPEKFASLTIFVVGGGVTGVACNPVIKIDNIRAVRN